MINNLLQHPRNNNISFDPVSHRYWYYPDGISLDASPVEFKGITSWISSYCEPFDKERMAYMCSRKPSSPWFNMDVEDIKQAWTEKGRKTAERGDAIHKAIEDYVNHGTESAEHKRFVEAFKEAMKEWKITPRQSEMLVYHEYIARATPIDLVGEREEAIVPMDIKTFEKGMEYEAYRGKTMLGSLSHLEDTKYNKVSLQISLERVFLEDVYGIESQTGYCLLMNEDTHCEVIAVKDLRKEARTMVVEAAAP